jgi:hypothetical protein
VEIEQRSVFGFGVASLFAEESLLLIRVRFRI